MARGPNDTYVQQLRSYFEKIIVGLELTDLQKDFLRGRWLDQLLWFEKKSGYNQRRYFILRSSASSAMASAGAASAVPARR